MFGVHLTILPSQQSYYRRMIKKNITEQPDISANQRYFTQNARILKLIQTKMQPLQKSTSTKLLLPKIQSRPKSPKKEKRYIEIEIMEEEDAVASTQIEQEHKFKMERRRTNYRLNSRHITQSNLLNQQLPRKTESPSMRCGWSFQDEITLDKQRNQERLKRIQQEIDCSKRKFVDTIKLSECAGDCKEKENCSFEYLVNRIEAEREERLTKNSLTSAYEGISPNKLSDYIGLLQPSKNTHCSKIEEEMPEAVVIEPRSRRHLLKKKTTMMASDYHDETENVASKLRLKANHRRLIEFK